MTKRSTLALCLAAALLPGVVGASHYQDAVRYLDGSKVARDPARAVHHLAAAVRDEGSIQASYLLARLQLKGVGTPRSPQQAARSFYRAARKGHVKSQFALGVLFAKGLGVDRSPAKAQGWLGLAAAAGHPRAERLLARLGGHVPAPLDQVVLPLDEVDGELREFVRGMIGAEDLAAARQAGEAGSVMHQVLMGVAHEIGIQVPVDAARAADWYRQAAENGSGEAARRLGTMYRKGVAVTADPQEAARWYAIGARQGDSLSLQYLAAMHTVGEGVAPDPGRALALMDRAAEKGVATEKYLIGLRYAQGVGAPRDPERARKWLEAAAPGLSRDLRFRIGALLYSGEGVARDPAAGRRWIESAAAAGDADAMVARELLARTPAPERLAVEGTDFATAIHELPEAMGRFLKRVNSMMGHASKAMGGDGQGGLAAMMAQMTAVLRQQITPEVAAQVQARADAGDAEAQRLLGTLHMVGVRVGKDPAAARRWIEAAAAQDDAQAFLLLGQLHMLGTGGKLDYEKAADCWQKSADLGLPQGRLQMAQAHLFGLGVKQDAEKGEAMLRELAALPDVAMQYTVALMFESGMGVPQDLDLARDLLGRCHKAGFEPAAQLLAEMEAR